VSAVSAPGREGVERVALPQGIWSVDSRHSRVSFSVKHMVFTTVNGSFREFEGTMEVGPGVPRATGRVRAASIDTGDLVRDGRLRSSADFFDVGSHPEIGFRSSESRSPPSGGFASWAC
jgi:polyisoprenoid-binding protein YceI